MKDSGLAWGSAGALDCLEVMYLMLRDVDHLPKAIDEGVPYH